MFFARAARRWGIDRGSPRARATGVVLALALAIAAALAMPRLPAGWHLNVLAPGWLPYQLVRLIEYSNDLQVALVADRPSAPHPDIALVLIREETLADLAYFSPIDRGRLGDIVKAVDGLGARVIGLDILIDSATEPEKDRAFADVVTRRRAAVVLGGADERAVMSERRRAFQARFLADRKLPYGFFNLRYDVREAADGSVVRARAAPYPGSMFGLAFAEAVAKVSGVQDWPQGRRIPWLADPRGGGDTFLTLDAEAVLAAEREPDSALARAIETQLLNRIVLIGADLDGRDRHPTPLTRVSGEDMLGVAIHAQILAGLIDGRSIVDVGQVALAVLSFLAALLGTLAGWFAARRRLVLLGLIGVGIALVLATSAIVLWQSQAIVPLAGLSATLVGTALGGRMLRSLLGV